jgi:hypothetical protein
MTINYLIAFTITFVLGGIAGYFLASTATKPQSDPNVLDPGDGLLIRVDTAQSTAEHEQLMSIARERLGGRQITVIKAEQLIVVKPS